MTRLLVAFAVLSVSGCLCARECGGDADCGDGSFCGPQKLCEARPDGGTGGGATGGGSPGGGTAGGATSGGMAGGATSGGMAGGSSGGGVTAGGTAGGGTAGGAGGGMPAVCTPTCAEWASCSPLADAGLGCVPGVLVVTAPVDGESVPARGSVPLFARLELQDGGAWPTTTATIPVTTSWGQVVAPIRTGTASSVMASAGPGVGSVTFGWVGDAGPVPSTITRAVSFTDCSLAITNTVQPWEKCVPTETGGRREAVVLLVAFASPAAGTTYGPGVSVPATVVLTLATDAGSFDGSVPWNGQGTLSATGNTRPGTAMSPMANGPFSLFAGWDGGPSGSVTLQVDAVGPGLTWKLQADGGPGGGKRDELVLVQLESNEALQAAPQVAFEDAGVRLVGGGACVGWPCGGARCDCYELDLAVPDLMQFSGQFGLQASVRDVFGNPGSTSANVPVTRLRWRTNVAVGGASPLRAAPALDSQGNLYLGTDDTGAGTTGRLVSLNPIDGGMRTNFPISTGAVQSISINQSRIDSAQTVVDVVYANSNVATGSKLELIRTSGTALSGGFTDTNRTTSAALALFRADNNPVPEIGAATVYNSGVLSGRVSSASPVQGQANSMVDPLFQSPVPGSSPANSPVNVVVFGKDGGAELIFVLDDGASIRQLNGQRFIAGAWSAVGSSPTLGPNGTPVALCAVGGSTLVSMTNRTPALLVSKSLQAPLGVPDAGNPNAPSTNFAPVLAARASGATAIFGTNLSGAASSDWLFSSVVDPAAPNFGVPVGLGSTPSANRLVTSPVIGGGGLPHGMAGNADRLFAVTQDGTLRSFVVSAVDGVAGGSPEWTATPTEVLGLGGTRTVYAHPTLDCGTRPFSPGRPGVLYVVATDGTVAAILVDSSKLSTTAPWPKWQRTAGNAGNDDELLFPRNPGCN